MRSASVAAVARARLASAGSIATIGTTSAAPIRGCAPSCVRRSMRSRARAIAELPPARTLDVACGTGFLTRHLRGDIVGLDQSERMLALARERLPRATFVSGDALRLPFGEGTFDRLFTSYFYCHLETAERERFLGEARRVARELVVVASVLGEG